MKDVEIIKPDSVTHEIIAAHDRVCKEAESMADHAIIAGELLVGKKREVGHGNFEDYVKDFMPFNCQTARLYMKLFKNAGMIEAKRQHVGELSIRGAAALIDESKPKKPKSPTTPASSTSGHAPPQGRGGNHPPASPPSDSLAGGGSDMAFDPGPNDGGSVDPATKVSIEIKNAGDALATVLKDEIQAGWANSNKDMTFAYLLAIANLADM